jgi:DNA-binding transcriptional ArsR family regulator
LKYNEAMGVRTINRKKVFEIDDLETLDVLNDPLRMRILHLCAKEARTVKELAEILGVPVTRLYYHVNMLHDSGIIEVAETEKVGAMIQRRFRATADDYRLSKAAVESIRDDQRAAQVATATILDGARLDAEALLSDYFAHPDAGERKGSFGRNYLVIDPDRLAHWRERIDALIEEIETESEDLDDRDGCELYGLTYVFAPVAGPMRGPVT